MADFIKHLISAFIFHQIQSRRGDKHFLYGQSSIQVVATKVPANDDVFNYLKVWYTSYAVPHRNAPLSSLLRTAAEELHGIQDVGEIPIYN